MFSITPTSSPTPKKVVIPIDNGQTFIHEISFFRKGTSINITGRLTVTIPKSAWFLLSGVTHKDRSSGPKVDHEFSKDSVEQSTGPRGLLLGGN